LDRIDGFAQLIQHVVEQQLVFIFQRYAQTRAKTLSKAERSAIAKGAVATMRGQEVVGEDGEIMNGLAAKALAAAATMRRKEVVRAATRKRGLQTALNRTPLEDLEMLLPDSLVEVVAGINDFATPQLLGFVQLHKPTVRVLRGFLACELQSMLSYDALSHAVGSFQTWQQQHCSSGDRFMSKATTDIWQVGRALSESWQCGELKTRVEALVAADTAAQDTQFSDTKTKLVDGVRYLYQIRRNSAGNRTGARYCVDSDRGRLGGWWSTTLEADTSCFDDDHRRPFSTIRAVLVQRLTTLRENAGNKKKVGVTYSNNALITQIIQMEKKAAGGVAGKKTKEKKETKKKRKKGGTGDGAAAVTGNGEAGGKGGDEKKPKKKKTKAKKA
jgi:hypothetical protein